MVVVAEKRPPKSLLFLVHISCCQLKNPGFDSPDCNSGFVATHSLFHRTCSWTTLFTKAFIPHNDWSSDLDSWSVPLHRAILRGGINPWHLWIHLSPLFLQTLPLFRTEPQVMKCAKFNCSSGTKPFWNDVKWKTDLDSWAKSSFSIWWSILKVLRFRRIEEAPWRGWCGRLSVLAIIALETPPFELKLRGGILLEVAHSERVLRTSEESLCLFCHSKIKCNRLLCTEDSEIAFQIRLSEKGSETEIKRSFGFQRNTLKKIYTVTCTRRIGWGPCTLL